jgi:methionyl-tRNA synthetase
VGPAFHAQIWPAELLGYNASPGPYGVLNLPTEVVSSEYLTQEGRKFSSSRSVVIYVRDVLERYGPDALRYFIAVAGPETHDSDFTWSEFVRRNNDELVGTWGNLVNRTASMIAKNFGAIPAAGALTPADRDLLASSKEAFGTVGAHLGHHRLRLGIGAAMKNAADANQYLSQQAPWKETDQERKATILHVAAQVVADSNRLLAPFLPHSAQKVHETLGGTGTFQPQPEVREVDDLDGGPSYPIITGDYTAQPRWESEPVVPGTVVRAPTPVFAKLPPEVVDEELARLG